MDPIGFCKQNPFAELNIFKVSKTLLLKVYFESVINASFTTIKWKICQLDTMVFCKHNYSGEYKILKVSKRPLLKAHLESVKNGSWNTMKWKDCPLDPIGFCKQTSWVENIFKLSKGRSSSLILEVAKTVPLHH